MTTGEKEAMKCCLGELFKNGSGYAKIFQGGEQFEIKDQDLVVIVDFLNQGILKQIEKYQSLDKSDLDEISELYQQIVVEDRNPKESILKYFESFNKTSQK